MEVKTLKKEEVIPIRIQKEEKELLEKYAEEQGVGVSTLVRLLIREYLAKKE